MVNDNGDTNGMNKKNDQWHSRYFVHKNNGFKSCYCFGWTIYTYYDYFPYEENGPNHAKEIFSGSKRIKRQSNTEIHSIH